MSAKAEVLMTGPIEPHLEAALDAQFTVHKPWLASDPKAFQASVADRVRAVVTRSGVGADEALMVALPKLELVSVFGVGAEKIDIKAAKARGIHVTTTPGVLTEDTADYAFGLMMALARRMVEGDRFIRTGQWLKGRPADSTRVYGKKLGIIGLGRIGEAIARRATAFAMEVSYNGPREKKVPYRYFADPKALAEHADFIILACPGGPETANIVDAGFLKALGKNGMLVNIARASVVNEPALIEALTNGIIKAAALDVFPDEPKVSEAMLNAPNAVLEPHIASTTEETRKAIGELVFENVKAHFAGLPLPTPIT